MNELENLSIEAEPDGVNAADWADIEIRATPNEGKQEIERVTTRRIPDDHYMRLSNSQLLYYLDKDPENSLSQPITEAHLLLADRIDGYVDINKNRNNLTTFSLDTITREYFQIEGKHQPTPQQRKEVFDMLDTLTHTHIITRNEKGEPISRAILYIQITLKNYNGTIMPTYDLTGYTALYDYARSHSIKYTSIRSEYIRLPKGINRTLTNAVLQYIIIKSIKEKKPTVLFNLLYIEGKAKTRKDRLKIRQSTEKILLDCLKNEEIDLKSYEILEDDHNAQDLPSTGYKLLY